MAKAPAKENATKVLAPCLPPNLKSHYIVTSHSKYTRTLIFKNLWHRSLLCVCPGTARRCRTAEGGGPGAGGGEWQPYPRPAAGLPSSGC